MFTSSKLAAAVVALLTLGACAPEMADKMGETMGMEMDDSMMKSDDSMKSGG